MGILRLTCCDCAVKVALPNKVLVVSHHIAGKTKRMPLYLYLFGQTELANGLLDTRGSLSLSLSVYLLAFGNERLAVTVQLDRCLPGRLLSYLAG